MRLLFKVLAIAGVLLAVVIGVMFGIWNYAITTAALSTLLFIVTLESLKTLVVKSLKWAKAQIMPMPQA